MFETPGQIVPHHVVVNANPRKLKDEIDLEHAEIARAVTAGHANRACGLMEDHIRAMVEHYRVEIGDQMHDFIEWR